MTLFVEWAGIIAHVYADRFRVGMNHMPTLRLGSGHE